MGKTKNRKHKPRSNNPTGMPTVRDVEEECELSGEKAQDSSVDELRDMLQGGNVEERECAACIMANLAKDPESCESLIEASVIRTAAPLLLDRNLSVRHSVAGALRNVSAISHEACSALVNYDVMTPLVALLNEYNCFWEPAQNKKKIDSKSEIFFEAVHLLWNLCESSETSLSIFNKEKLWNVLLPCLNVNKYGTKIATAVGHCLHAASEDNAGMAESMKDFKELESIFQNPSQEPGHVLLKVLISGILINLTEAQEEPPNLSLASVMSVLTSALSLPVIEAIVGLADMVTELKGSTKKKNVDVQAIAEKEEALENAFNLISDTLTAKQTALEILSNLCCGQDATSKDDDLEDSDDSTEVFDGDMDVEESSAVVRTPF